MSQCRGCTAPMAADQRYCLECGSRAGSPRVEPGPVLVALATASAAAHEAGGSPPVAADGPPAGSAAEGAGESGAAGGGVGSALASRPALAAGMALLMVGLVAGAAFSPPASNVLASQRPVVIVQAPGAPAQGPPATPAGPNVITITETGPSSAAGGGTPSPGVPSTPTAPGQPTTPDQPAEPTDPTIGHFALVLLPGGKPGQTLVQPAARHAGSPIQARLARPAAAAAEDWSAPFKSLRSKSLLLKGFGQVSASGFSNRMALFSGMEPNKAMEAGCTGSVSEVKDGDGCLVPAPADGSPDNLLKLAAQQLGDLPIPGGKQSVRVYVETPSDAASRPDGDYSDLCRPIDNGSSPPVAADGTPPPQDNPLLWFRSVARQMTADDQWWPAASRGLCTTSSGEPAGRIRPLSMLGSDLAAAASKDAAQADPSLGSSFPVITVIIPSRCRVDASVKCPDGKTAGGPVALQAFLDGTVAKTLGGSKVFLKDGASIVAWDRKPVPPARKALAAATTAQPAVGAFVLSPFAKAGVSTTTAYDTYSLLRTISERLGIAGGAGQPRLLGKSANAKPLGKDVFPPR